MVNPTRSFNRTLQTARLYRFTAVSLLFTEDSSEHSIRIAHCRPLTENRSLLHLFWFGFLSNSRAADMKTASENEPSTSERSEPSKILYIGYASYPSYPYIESSVHCRITMQELSGDPFCRHLPHGFYEKQLQGWQILLGLCSKDMCLSGAALMHDNLTVWLTCNHLQY